MSTKVTLTLSDELYEQAKPWAAITQRDLLENLTNALTIVLTPAHTALNIEQPVSNLSNEDVIALSQPHQSQMARGLDNRPYL